MTLHYVRSGAAQTNGIPVTAANRVACRDVTVRQIGPGADERDPPAEQRDRAGDDRAERGRAQPVAERRAQRRPREDRADEDDVEHRQREEREQRRLASPSNDPERRQLQGSGWQNKTFELCSIAPPRAPRRDYAESA